MKATYSARKWTSDQKSFDEVLHGWIYAKKFPITPDMYCVDMWVNVGAFALYCYEQWVSDYVGYEPDPLSFKCAEHNFTKNKVGEWYRLFNKWIVASAEKVGYLNINTTGNYRRNSLCHSFQKWKKVKVGLVDIAEEIDTWKKQANGKDIFLKIDIEGSEMDILERVDLSFAKYIVYEWSFDVDPSITRYKKVLEKLEKQYHIKHHNFPQKVQEAPIWKKERFPMYCIAYCVRK